MTSKLLRFFLQFQVMRPKQEKDTEDLYQTTRKLLENYAKLKSSQYLASDSALKAQSALYSIVREGKELAGMELNWGWGGVEWE